MILPDPIKMAPAKFIALLLLLYAKRVMGALAVALTAAAVCGFIFDWRFAILALMIFFILIPLILALVYIVHGTKPLVSFNASLHSLSLRDDGILVEFPPAEENIPAPKSVFIEKTGFGSSIASSHSLIITLKGKRGFIWIPYSSITPGCDLLDSLFDDRTMVPTD